MKKYSLFLFLAYANCILAQQNTTEGIALSLIRNDQGVVEDTLLADGNARNFVFTLDASSRQYVAYNMDITLPKGLSVGQSATGYAVKKTSESEIYSGTQHEVYSNLLSVTKLRVACFSIENEEFSATSGEVFEIQMIPAKSLKTGKYTLKLSSQNLTGIINDEVQKFVPEDREFEFYVITLSDAFNAYKTRQKDYVASLANEDDSQAVKSLITKAQANIMALSFQGSNTLEENKASVDAIVEQLISDITTQRAADKLAAEKANFEAYKTTANAIANDLILTTDGSAVQKLVSDAQGTITALAYDEDKTLEENKARIDAVIEKLKSDIATQRAADKTNFEEYKTSQSTAASDLLEEGDGEAVRTLIVNAQNAIAALVYDESKSLEDNKKRVDAIIEQLVVGIATQRSDDELAADKAVFELYKTNRSTATNELLKEGDSDAIQKLVIDAQNTIAALVYDESKTLEDNKSRVDAIIEQLSSDIETQRAADKLAAEKANFEAYKTTANAIANDLILTTDGSAVQKLVSDAQGTITALVYDEDKTLEENKARIDAVIEKLKSDIATQRAADKTNFEEYKTSQSTAASDLLEEGDGEAVRTLIVNAQNAIAALVYDENKSLEDNKKRVDAIIEQLVVDIATQRSDDELAANKAVFEQYKIKQSTAANELLEEGDGEDVRALIVNAQNAIAALVYDENKSLSDNKAIVDAIIKQLATTIQEQRLVDSIIVTNARINTGENHIYTLSGKRIQGIISSGIYIINGKKIMLK